jgi:CubicO group peptidase (beta-lactamase class C family)
MPTGEELAEFERLVRLTMRCRKMPALTLTLVKQGRVLLTATLGHADPYHHMAVSRDTRFAIGSLTKAFTATLVADRLKRLR